MPTATPEKKSTGNKPVYKDGEIAVFLNTRNRTTGERAGESFEVFTYVRGEGTSAHRIDVDAEIAGYKLQNSNTERRQFSDVVDLVHRGQILVEAPKKAGGTYPLIIAALPVKEKEAGEKKFRSLPLVTATPIWSKDDREGEEIKRGSEPIGFKIKSRMPDRKLSEHFDVSCFCTTNVKGIGRVEITVADAIAARDALAEGKTHSFERDGIVVTGVGIKPVANSTNGLKTFEWKLEKAASNDSPLPGRGQQQGRTASR